MGLLTDSRIDKALDADGAVCPNAKRYVYQAGTDMLAPIYNDLGLTSLMANPEIADANGAFDLCYLRAGGYSIQIENSAGYLIASASDVTVKDPILNGIRLGFQCLADVLADELMSYVQDNKRLAVEPGDLIWAIKENFTYKVADQEATSFDLSTVSGVKLCALPFCTDAEHAVYHIDAFGGPGDGVQDDTAFFIKAAGNGGRHIQLGAKTYRVSGNNNAAQPTAGTFNIPSNTVIEGAGIGVTTVMPFDTLARGAFSAEGGRSASDGIDDNLIENVVIRGIAFQGTLESEGHYEFAHLCNFSGCRNWLIEECAFVGPRGDGISFASGNSGSPEHARRQYDITVRKCQFDGVINGAEGGRNAISIIDVDGMLIEDCTFRRWSRNDMPGSLCIEPNTSVQQIRNVRIVGNRFHDCAGNRGHIAMSLDNCNNENVENIWILDNYFDGSYDGGTSFQNAVTIYTDHDAADFPTNRMNIHISRNRANDVEVFVQKQTGHIFGLYIEDNVIARMSGGGNNLHIGDNSSTWIARDVRIVGNRIHSNAPQCLTLPCNTEQAAIKGNTFDGATQEAVSVGSNSAGTLSEHVFIEDNLTLGSPTFAARAFGTVDWGTGSYLRNHGTVTDHNLGMLKTDFCGSRYNIRNFNNAPEDFPVGESQFRIEASTNAPSNPAMDYGLVKVIRHTTRDDAASTVQWFYPDYRNSGYAARGVGAYFRKQTAVGTWGVWVEAT